ncbi:FAD:protein FMN transferase [Alicyclobacillus contaminans]|uniref:FAD:protein FMN transferase n=1 Tax=Alicyclobacillus contaminans TaxID=392016 RepID=UPI0012EBF698|nr:FAD:protein FMN transferase [Alicyclobacillus contaminans]
MNRLRFRAMGTDVEMLVADGAPVEADGALQCARDEMERLEAMLSRFRQDSDVSRINAAPGQWVTVREETVRVLELAKQAFDETEGLFNPCLGQVLEHIGYDVSFEQVEGRPVVRLNSSHPYEAPTTCPFEINPSQHRVLLHPGYKLDLGGIAKGWIVQRSALVLEQWGMRNFLVSAGGDLVCRGSNGERPWCVGIANPFGGEGDNVLMLDVTDMAVATSGTYRRRWSFHGTPVHHLIHPYFGVPAASDVVSCSALHPDLVRAEVLAKVGLLLGADAGRQWLQKRAVGGFVLVLKSGEVVHAWNS